jgi:glycosyltransferase involved in cell wall biosynthesis
VTFNNGIPHETLIQMMCKSWLYIGNSISDGMPNTLIEAIACGCLPIQSNPGNVSSELIKHQYNGMLINEPENIEGIIEILRYSIENKRTFINGLNHNVSELSKHYERSKVAKKINEVYLSILNG